MKLTSQIGNPPRTNGDDYEATRRSHLSSKDGPSKTESYRNLPLKEISQNTTIDSYSSKDKRPYKDHLDFAFWEGEKKASTSSLFFRVSSDGIFIGTGAHSCPQFVKAVRSAVADETSGKSLAAIANKVRKAGYELQGAHYKRTPPGFADDGPAAEFLLYDALYVMTEDKPQVACTTALMDFCIQHWRATMPLHRWLIEHVRA